MGKIILQCGTDLIRQSPVPTYVLITLCWRKLWQI